MESPEIKDETESEDIKPADSSTVALSSKEPLVLATLSSMFKKAEEKKRLYDYKYFPELCSAVVLPPFHSDVNVRGYTHNNMLIVNRISGRYYLLLLLLLLLSL